MKITKPANFSYLLIGLLITLLAGPVFNEFSERGAGLLIQIGFSGTLIVGIWSLIESRAWFITGVVLAVTELAITVITAIRPMPLMELFSLSIALAFCAMSLAFALSHVFVGRRMDGNRMIGAVCVYLLLGIVFGLINVFVYRLVPDSFSGISAAADQMKVLDLLYYTFVTMTTLGYGDITPVGPLARAVAYLTAIAGQFYIAILVGMVVGLYLSQQDMSD
jgi:voltage-gated potassium channel